MKIIDFLLKKILKRVLKMLKNKPGIKLISLIIITILIIGIFYAMEIIETHTMAMNAEVEMIVEPLDNGEIGILPAITPLLLPPN